MIGGSSRTSWTPSSKKSKCAEQEFGENSKGGVPTPTIVGTDLSGTGGLKQLECVMLSSYRGQKSQIKELAGLVEAIDDAFFCQT